MISQIESAVREEGCATETSSRRVSLAIGVALFVLLMFSTSTVFVRGLWPLETLQIGIYTLAAAYLLYGIQRGHENLTGISGWTVFFIPAWGIVQIVAHTTASTFETREAILRWGALAAVFFLTQVVARTRAARESMLMTFLCFAAIMAVLCLLQIFTSQGNVLWIFPSGYSEVLGTFPNHNNYAQFIEIALPIALWRALCEGWNGWRYALIGGVLYASVIGSASRAGAILCTAELLVILSIGLILRKRTKLSRFSRLTTTALVVVPLLAVLFTAVVGWQRVWTRFQQHDPYEGRREFMVAAIDMAEHRPLVGYGLGTFQEVYQQHAIRDFPFYANHAHNDWAEFAADGGIPFFLLMIVPFVAAVPTAIRHPWGLGIIAVMLHACVDYPFPRPAVSGWIFMMLGLLYVARTKDRSRVPESAGH